MIDFVRRSVACAAIVAGAVLAPAAIASATVAVPFQIDPYGSFDFPSVRCVAVVGEQPGTVTITGPEERKREGRSGCLQLSEVHWLNLSNGASGSTRMSDGSDAYPEAILPTGTGQVVLVVVHTGSSFVTPGIATVYVP
ncbi:hypothetical protein M2284_005337 [Rhodococcus sp. LBL1]|uniref:hypothetical protein n=1 Tax=Variovorax boronicumulans TaxID=436515 RepID=UPI002476270C|nr:hypothetical protein [Variovorax boronicumulans]MDH6171021.1 hypothetical protein [Variovorax boronicumulans]MDH6681093.1 hypothetical protein [Rhodococcus sp. LBL1]MDH6686373.1 hypothetical protein [Rhodococcus sp. LBL2]